jgi:hypothetical protein
MNTTMITLADARKRAWAAGLLLAFLLTLLSSTALAQETPPQAGLVIVGAEDNLITACVNLEKTSLTGLELLRSADIEHELSTEGGAVCSLAGVGCPTNDCFCECKGTPCRYWSYYHLDVDGTWAYSGVGAGAWTLRSGDVDAWVWGDGSQQPPDLRFEEICAPASERTPKAKSTLPTEGRSTPIATPDGESTPETRIFVPAVGSSKQAPQQGSILTRIFTWLDQGYRGFLLLLLALAALALLKWQPGENDESDSQ